jgi:hypothetical protein
MTLRRFQAMAAAVALGFAALCGNARAAGDDLVYFLTPESQTLFETANEKADFWPLIAAFVSETRETFCGIASSVMVLNALQLPPPVAPQWYPNQYWNEDNIFTRAVLEAVLPVQKIEAEGITLDQLAVLLRTSGAKVERTFAADIGLADFRTKAIRALADPNVYLVVNVGRAALGQGMILNGGHISPIGAYNAERDMFLMLDVARYKYKPSWIPAERLYRAMNTTDTTSGKSRGYVLVSK